MARIRYGLSLLVLFGLVGSTAPLLDAQAVGRISGHVRDAQSQRPIRSAVVQIMGTSLRATTDADGGYAIDSIPAGVVSVRATMVGHKAHELAGLRINGGISYLEDFTLEPAEMTLVQLNPGVLLRFQLIRPVAVRTTDNAIMPIDSVLRDLFQWPGYQLLSQTAIAVDAPLPSLPGRPGSGGSTYTHTALNVGGDAYDLTVQVDSVAPQRVRMTVSLTGYARGTGAQAASGHAAASPMIAKTLLTTSVSVSFGHTVVLGSTQPGSGRGGMSGTLILAVRPEVRSGDGQ